MAWRDSTDTHQLLGGLIDMPQQHVMRIVLLGVGLGVVGFLLSLIIRDVILVPVFCGNVSVGKCAGVADSAANISAVIVAIAGLLGLVRLSVYRPLLIVLAVAISFWGLGSLTVDLPWYEALSWWVLFYAAGYTAFAWLVRPRAFLPTLLIIITAVALIRILSAL